MNSVTILKCLTVISGVVLLFGCLTYVVIYLISKKKKTVFNISCIMGIIVSVSLGCFAIGLTGSILIDYLQNKYEKAQESIIETSEKMKEKREDKIEEVKTKVRSSGYIAYMDGIEVDIDNVNLEYYIITIDDEQKKIFMTANK